MPTPQTVRDKLINEIKFAFFEYTESFGANFDIAGDRACFAWAVFTEKFLQDKGFNAVMRAGNLHWSRCPGSKSSIVDTPAFAREFTSVSDGQMLKDYHCWVELPDAKEIVDMFTGFFPHRLKEEYGLAWSGPKPPHHLWAHCLEFTQGKYFGCNYQAIPACHDYVTSDAKKALDIMNRTV